MNCEEFLRRYSDYDDSLLAPPELARFRDHLGGCASCTRYDRVLRKGRMLARQAAAVPSADFIPRLQTRLHAEPGLRPARRPMPAGPVAAGGFLTLTVAAVAGMWVFGGDTYAADAGLRVTSLPAAAWVGPADWTAGRVDRRGSSSYSPLVIGPPAHAGEDRSLTTRLTSTTRRSLD